MRGEQKNKETPSCYLLPPPNPNPLDILPMIDFRGCDGCACGCGCAVFALLRLTGLLIPLTTVGVNLPVLGSLVSGGGVSAS